MVAALFFCILIFVGCGKKDELIFETQTEILKTDGGSERLTERSSEPVTASEKRIYVDVCGAVKHPGVYCLTEGARVYEAIELAGGFRFDADSEVINQAQILQDGMQIKVYTQEETSELEKSGIPLSASEQGLSSDSKDPEMDGKINLNTADKEQLCSLPGIGEVRAEEILAYRSANGGFSSIEEIMKVNGIKEATFQKIKDRIAV